MPTREREQDLEPTLVDRMTYKNGALVSTVSQVSFYGHQEMTDTVTPNFHQEISSGAIINNPMTFSSFLRYFSDYTCPFSTVALSNGDIRTYEGGNQTMHFLDNVYNPYVGQPLPPLSTYSLESVAKQKCIAKIDATPTEFFEDLGEIRETINFFRNPLQSLERLLKTFVQHKRSLQGIRNQVERAQAIADLYKTYRFAVSPLMKSMVDLMELLANKEPTRPKRRRASGRSNRSGESDTPTVYRATPVLYNQVIQYEALGYRQLDYHATVLYEVSNPLVDWLFKLGLRVKDIPTTAWELVPKSFMIDRLLDIRSFVAGLVNFLDPTVTFLAGSLTIRNLSQYTYSLTDYQHALYTVTLGPNYDFVQFEDFSMERQEWSPSVFDTIPVFTPRGLVKDLASILDLITIIMGILPGFNGESSYKGPIQTKG